MKNILLIMLATMMVSMTTTPVAFSSKISRKSSRSNRTSIFSFLVVVKIDVFSFYPLPLQPRGCLSGVH